MTYYDSRNTVFKNRVNSHLKKLTGQDRDFYSSITQSDLIELRNDFADINNVLTFKTTITAANWLCKLFKFDPRAKKATLNRLDKDKPNKKGFDIHIVEPYKIIAEVKCISPENKNGKFGAIQLSSILGDAYKLKNGKNVLKNTSNYFKFIFLLDLGDRTDQAVTHLLKTSTGTSGMLLRINRHQIKEHISLLSGTEKFADLKLDKVYLKKIKIDP